MKTNKIAALSIIVLLIIFNSCVDKEKPSKNYSSDVIDRYKVFKVDSVTSNTSRVIDYFSNNDLNVFSIHNEPTNEIVLYNFENAEEIMRIKIETTGPKTIGTIKGYKIHSEDSIFVATDYSLVVIDWQGEIISKHSTTVDKIANGIQPFTYNSIILLKNKFYLDIIPEKNPFEKEYYSESTSLKLVLDLSTDEIQLGLNYPESYQNNIWGANTFHYSTFNTVNNEFIYSFPYSDNITSHSENVALTTSSVTGVGKSFKPYEGTSGDNYMKYFYEEPSYYAILFDPFRNVYYRYFHEATDYESIVDGDGLRETTIVVLDKNFNKIHEYNLPKGKFMDFMSFVSADGLMIASNNMADEDLIIYSLITFSEEE